MPISSTAFFRSTVLGIAAVFAALAVIVGATLWLVNATAHYTELLIHARLQRSALVDLRTLLDDAETGQRGYLLTGNAEYLKPYEDAHGKIGPQIERISQLLPDEASQTSRLSEIIAGKLAELDHTIVLFKAGSKAEAMEVVQTNRGRDLMDEARELFLVLIAGAEQRIGTTVIQQERSIGALRWVTIVSALVILGVVGEAVWVVVLYMRQLEKTRREVEALNVGLEARVSERTSDLARANDEIQRFAYIVTHDLRAPLVNIMGFTSELAASLKDIQDYVGDEKSPLSAAQDPKAKAVRAAALEDAPEAIGFIRSSTQKMDGLINAILKLSREGRRTLKPETIHLPALLEAASGNVRHQVAEAGGEIVIEGDVRPIISDKMALEQVFGNLLDNAAKYRMPGRPLHIKIRLREGLGKRIIVEVEDNGRGIASQDHDRVFELFRRSGTQDQKGEGIGLAHVRTVVRNLGGDIKLRSEFSVGTTMTVDLPYNLRNVLREI